MRKGVIEAAERATYVDVWQGLDQYGDMSPGELWAPAFDALVRERGGLTVFDAGCGSGKGALALEQRGYTVMCGDLTDDGLVDEARRFPFSRVCLWGNALPRRAFDWAFCCDVMEHVPKEFTMLTIARLLETSRRGVFLSITFVPDHFGVLVGKALHQTVEPFTWWRDRLGELGTVIDARDCLQTGIFLVEPSYD